jgi:hypothetical protein
MSHKTKLIFLFILGTSINLFAVDIYERLNFKNYVTLLLNDNDKAEEVGYQKKIDYILSEIKKDKYNFDVYADGYLGTGSSLTSQTLGGTTGVVPNVNGDYTGAGVSLNANKVLYDGEYSLINNTYDILYKRLADINELNEKDKLIVLGTSIYTNLYMSQEELKIFEVMYSKQQEVEEITSQSYKKDQKSIIDYIDARNDSLTLQRAIMDLKYQYVNNDYILRQSIKSKSEKPYKLFSEEFRISTDSLPLLEKEALKNNSDLVKESNILKLTQADLLSQQRRYYPQISFNSYIGYGLSDQKVFTMANASTGSYWQLGLNIKVPIYDRDDIRLNQEKGMYTVLKEKNIFSAQQKSVVLQVERSYHQIEKIEKQTKIIKEQLSLLSLKLEVSKKRYLSGISEYRVYSDALKGYLDYQNQMLKMQQQYTQEVSILSILLGRRNFYESN